MPTLFSAPAHAPANVVSGTSAQREMQDGTAVIDGLLSQLNPHDSTLLDAALDLRTLAAERQDAAACLQQLFRVRALLGRRHFNTFERVHAWARRALHVEVRPERGAPWVPFEISETSMRMEEVANTALAHFADGEFIPARAQVRFVFATAPVHED